LRILELLIIKSELLIIHEFPRNDMPALYIPFRRDLYKFNDKITIENLRFRSSKIHNNYLELKNGQKIIEDIFYGIPAISLRLLR